MTRTMERFEELRNRAEVLGEGVKEDIGFYEGKKINGMRAEAVNILEKIKVGIGEKYGDLERKEGNSRAVTRIANAASEFIANWQKGTDPRPGTPQIEASEPQMYINLGLVNGELWKENPYDVIRIIISDREIKVVNVGKRARDEKTNCQTVLTSLESRGYSILTLEEYREWTEDKKDKITIGDESGEDIIDIYWTMFDTAERGYLLDNDWLFLNCFIFSEW